MTTQRKRRLQKRNYLVPLLFTKTGAGQHKDRKREQKQGIEKHTKRFAADM